MGDEKITYSDVEEYERFFSLIPSFLLQRFAKKNTNVILKFESKVESFMANMNENQKNKLKIVLNSEIEELQAVMHEAYQRTGKKQYNILANPKYKEFIETNLNEIAKKVKN